MRLFCHAFLVFSLSALSIPPFATAAEPENETVDVRSFLNWRETPKAQPRLQKNAGPAHGPSGGRVDRDGHDHGDRAANLHDIETENLFGFTLGSDTAEAGAFGIALETVGRFDKRDGNYIGIGKKLELGYGVTDNLSVALSMLTDYHRVAGVTGLEDIRGFNFNGVGSELRWRLAKRGPNPVGITLHIEPSLQRYDELTGLRASRYGVENKLIFDTEVVRDRIFAAFNLLYEAERVREQDNRNWENSSKIGFAVAITGQFATHAFFGAEVRYLRAYEGLTPQTFVGEAIFAGPTLFWHFAKNAWIAATWNGQIAGREAGNPARPDLTNFERHHVRLKLGVEFEPTPTRQIRK